jgi:hypothetical protein
MVFTCFQTILLGSTCKAEAMTNSVPGYSQPLHMIQTIWDPRSYVAMMENLWVWLSGDSSELTR